ncbi:hypothetical protein [Microcystis phage Mae-JY30]
MQKPKTHIDTAMIERAVRFDATIFLGTGQFHTGHFERLEDAREAARRFGEVANNGRKGLVYAITAEGRSTLVPDAYEPATLIDGATTMNATTLSALDFAKLTAVIVGGAYKRSANKDAAVAKFLKAADEKGLRPTAERLLGQADMDFDTAEHIIFEAIKGGHASIPEVKANTPAEAMEAAAEATTSPRKRGRVAVDAPKPDAPKADKPATGKRAAILEAAQRGEVPAAPDFSANTHKPFRKKLEAVVAMVEAGDIAGLEAFAINPVSSSPKAIAKYRDLAVIALKAQAAGMVTRAKLDRAAG